jgi:hypothetical protein
MRQVPPGQAAFGVVANAQPLELPQVQRQSEREGVCKPYVGNSDGSSGKKLHAQMRKFEPEEQTYMASEQPLHAAAPAPVEETARRNQQSRCLLAVPDWCQSSSKTLRCAAVVFCVGKTQLVHFKSSS